MVVKTLEAREFLGEGAVFDHVGLVVESIHDAVNGGADIVLDERQRVSVAFVDAAGVRIELIEGAAENSPVTASLKRGHKLLHLCYRVPNIEAAIAAARANGFHRIARPVQAKAFDGREISWLFSKVYGLIELLEAPSEDRK